MSVQTILARLGAVKRFLAVQEGKATFDDSSAAQQLTMVSLLEQVSLSVGEAAEIAEALDGVPFRREDSDKILVELNKRVGAKVEALKPGRLLQQNYESWTNYLLQEQWDEVFRNPSVALEVLCAICRDDLGLRNALEPTSQKIAAVASIVKFGRMAAKLKSKADLKKEFEKVKKELKQKALPFQYIHVLPPSPAQFLQAYPSVALRIYANAGPVSCPLASDDIEAVRNRIRMRGIDIEPEVTNTNGIPTQLVAFGQELSQRLHTLQSQQMGMMDLFRGGHRERNYDGDSQWLNQRPRLGDAQEGTPQSSRLQLGESPWFDQSVRRQLETRKKDDQPLREALGDAPAQAGPSPQQDATILFR